MRSVNIGNMTNPLACDLPDFYCPECGRKMVYTEKDPSLYIGCCGKIVEIYQFRPCNTKVLSDAIGNTRIRLKAMFQANIAEDKVPSEVNRTMFYLTDGSRVGMLLHRSNAGHLVPDGNGFIVGRLDRTSSDPLPLQEYNALAECSIPKERIVRAEANGVLSIETSVYDGTVEYRGDGTYSILTDNR